MAGALWVFGWVGGWVEEKKSGWEDELIGWWVKEEICIYTGQWVGGWVGKVPGLWGSGRRRRWEWGLHSRERGGRRIR